MKKKGFTLVELLAVIAILAILVIIALPNVLGMFNQARKNTFVTELQSIYTTAETQFVSDQMNGMQNWPDGISYARVDGDRIAEDEGKYKLLDLQGTNTIDYFIHFNLAGKVTQFVASDGQFQFIYFGSELKKEDIKAVELTADSVDAKVAGGAGASINFASAAKFTRADEDTGEVNTGVVTIADAKSYATGGTGENAQSAWTQVKFDKDAKTCTTVTTNGAGE